LPKTPFPIDSLLISSNSSCWIVVIPIVQVLELDMFNWVTFNLKFNDYLIVVICMAIPGFVIKGYWKLGWVDGFFIALYLYFSSLILILANSVWPTNPFDIVYSTSWFSSWQEVSFSKIVSKLVKLPFILNHKNEASRQR
jgi:hypothetical protein